MAHVRSFMTSISGSCLACLSGVSVKKIKIKKNDFQGHAFTCGFFVDVHSVFEFVEIIASYSSFSLYGTPKKNKSFKNRKSLARVMTNQPNKIRCIQLFFSYHRSYVTPKQIEISVRVVRFQNTYFVFSSTFLFFFFVQTSLYM